MQEKFNRQIETHKLKLKKYNAIFGVVGYLKLFSVILLCISFYFMFSKGFPLKFIMSSILIFIILTAFWIYHEKVHDKIDYSNGVISINQCYLDRISGRWTDFIDIGEEFIDPEHAYACDLDIVGKKSLFQFLNITHTWHGRQAFANDLLYPKYSGGELLKRQKAISELSKDIEFATHMEYHLSKIGIEKNVLNIVDELKDKRPFLKNKIVKFILQYMPVPTVLLISAMVIFQTKILYLLGASVLTIQALLWVAGMPKNHKYLRMISNLPYRLSEYSVVIDILKNKDFTSEKLKQIQTQLGTSDLSAAQAMKELAEISDKRNAVHNAVIGFVFNILFLWDYSCSILYEEWKNKYADMAEDWFLALGEFESLLSFSVLPNICSNTCLPDITAQKKIEAAGIGHPLLSNDIRVNNDVHCNNNIFIISGSNMSGKTTYLRTVGINLVLARAGAFVCGEHMLFPSVNLMTSMRIADDLNDGISTFYAELKRIKSIIELAQKEPDMIFLIDEIFRGTNSVDRLSGARTVISKLNELGAVGIITTHDLELCELSKQSLRIKNYSFSEYYMENEIRFTFKIQEGKSKTTNAKFLMKMVGIL